MRAKGRPPLITIKSVYQIHVQKGKLTRYENMIETRRANIQLVTRERLCKSYSLTKNHFFMVERSETTF